MAIGDVKYIIIQEGVDPVTGKHRSKIGHGCYQSMEQTQNAMFLLVADVKDQMVFPYDLEDYAEEYGESFWKAYNHNDRSAWFVRFEILGTPERQETDSSSAELYLKRSEKREAGEQDRQFTIEFTSLALRRTREPVTMIAKNFAMAFDMAVNKIGLKIEDIDFAMGKEISPGTKGPDKRLLAFRRNRILDEDSFSADAAPGALVDHSVVDAMRTKSVLTTKGFLQDRMPYRDVIDPKTGKPRSVYATFYETQLEGVWKFCGYCFTGETENRLNFEPERT